MNIITTIGRVKRAQSKLKSGIKVTATMGESTDPIVSITRRLFLDTCRPRRLSKDSCTSSVMSPSSEPWPCYCQADSDGRRKDTNAQKIQAFRATRDHRGSPGSNVFPPTTMRASNIESPFALSAIIASARWCCGVSLSFHSLTKDAFCFQSHKFRDSSAP